MRSGDDDFERFVAARGGALLAYARVLVGGRLPEAEDLFQDALLRVLKHWTRIAPNAHEAYLRRTLQRLAMDDRRRRRRRPQITRDPLSDNDRPSATNDAATGVADRHDLLAALSELPARQRVVVVLRYWEDRPEREVAELLGIPVGTVKGEASRGLARLRKVIGAWEAL